MLETRAVEVYNGLAESSRIVRHTDWDNWSDRWEDRLLHLYGNAVPEEAKLKEDFFGVSAPHAVKLERIVEMFQWKEERHTVRRGDVEDTEYRYHPVWESSPIDSHHFHVQNGQYINPPANSWPVQSSTITSSNIMLGPPRKKGYSQSSDVKGLQYIFGSDLVYQLDNWRPLPLTAGKNAPSKSSLTNFEMVGNKFYLGDRFDPRVGDLRVSFRYVPAEPVSVIAGLEGHTLVPHLTRYNRHVLLLEEGNVDAQSMIAHAVASNTAWTWAGRVGLFIMMWVGVSMITSIVDTLVGWIPLLGSIARFLTGVVSFLAAVALFSVTFAFAWLWARPMLSAAALCIAAAIVYMSHQRQSTAPVPPAGKGGHGYESVPQNVN
eukprot:TRINITY_DN1257_c0_g1_i2.p1 TRINITY_DN1257_c0_g1~~TRINITY_DN1257_c0_g1_i2.p1  ORF type:complete len:377 (+),score=77.82 TRINITY_DN1257_c0_g1_i2:532-1662(+)